MKYFILVFSLIFITKIVAQNNDLYTPLNIKKAYQKETRNSSGLTGKNYWQNSSDYKIKVKVEPGTRKISGSEIIKYYNNSPDSLKEIVIRLYQDIFQKGNSRDFRVDSSDVGNGVEITKIKLRGEDLDLENKSKVIRYGTNMIIKLDNYVAPNSQTEIIIDWNFTLDKSTGLRMGTVDSTSFFIAYWYPQISVYDDIDGWDKTNYSGHLEFYNDFNNYDVEITAPRNFVVWATGNLENPGETFSNRIFERYRSAMNSDSVFKIITKEDLGSTEFTKAQPEIIWKYKAEKVPDFAFALSNHYLWDASSVNADNKDMRKVFVSAVYPEGAEDFYEIADITRKIIKMYSEEIPYVPYPYNSMTVFRNSEKGGGMEFPMIVNDGEAWSRNYAIGLTLHEVTHTFFPFYMGINERKYPWMDEGWAEAYAIDIENNLIGIYYSERNLVSEYLKTAGNEFEAPLMVPGISLRGDALTFNSYRKSSLAYYILRQLLGDEIFSKALNEFMRRWHGKHPLPYDFFNTFNRVTNRNLNWFWNSWFFNFGFPDVAVKNVVQKNQNVEITLENKGGLPVPLQLNLFYENGKIDSIRYGVEIWENNKEYKINLQISEKLDQVTIGSDLIPDSVSENNIFKIK